jgi:hypothetical protein
MPPKLKRQPTEEDCQKWKISKRENPDKPTNPISGYTIGVKSPYYKLLNNECKGVKTPPSSLKTSESKTKEKKDIHKSKQLTEELCIQWTKNKYRNPLTNYTIKENGAKYKEIEEECNRILSKTKTKPKPKSASPPKPKPKTLSSKSPSVLSEKLPSNSLSIKTIYNEKEEIKYKAKDNYFPDITDSKFRDKLMALKEINVHKINKYDDINSIEDFEKKASELCSGFDKSFFQYLMGHYLSYRMPYKSILIYYSVGVGKTCTAITIAENFLISHNSYEEPKIWVIMPAALEYGFKQQIFENNDYKHISDQCTGDLYVKLGQINETMSDVEVDKKIKKIIKSRYRIFTYEGFATFYENNYSLKGKVAQDKIIIVDEAHNIRQGNTDEKKRVYDKLLEVANEGINNKMILLSATPMYNEPTDIFDLIELLLLNDKRTDYVIPSKIFDDNNELYPEAKEFLEKTASTYISYLRGKNPFNFAFKLSPKLSDIKILKKTIPLTENGNPIENMDKKWIKKVSDGIIISELGKNQIEYLRNKKIVDENIQNNFKGLQPMNIVYDNALGSKGFYNFFRRSTDANKESYSVSYNTKYKNALIPDEEHLGLYSGKILNIMNIIRNTKGVIIIYSKYLHSGIIPTCIALEHMGFSRYGTDNLLENPTIMKDTPTYEGIRNPRYCILTSDNNDTKIMGGTTIGKLINIINNPNNINGEEIKIVLMSPIAGEGLNIKNVREIHLLEAWYHFNRIDQIIGRGIRNCSHKLLPLSKRNVTVFMHCAIENYERETADVHAYRISSRKLYQSSIVDTIIRNNSIDCSLFKDINYFPKSMFKLGNIELETSQGVKIDYQLGDDELYEPKCSVIDDNEIDERGFRQDTYKHLALNTQMKLRKLLLKFIQDEKYYVSYEDINAFFKTIDINILMYAISSSIYPNIIIDGYIIVPHENGIHIIKVVNDIPLKIALIKNDKEKEEVIIEQDDIKLYKDFIKYKEEPFNKAIIALYSSLDMKTFNFIIKKIFENKKLNEIDNFIANCLYKEGVLIAGKEIPSYGSPDKYIGFINIFNDNFEPLFYNDGNFKALNSKQTEQLLSNRKQIIIPDMNKEKLLWGLFVPVYENKENKNKINVFKILTAGKAVGKKTGIVCTSLHKSEHETIFKDLELPEGKFTKNLYCSNIAEKLYKINRISLNPEWKPTIIV